MPFHFRSFLKSLRSSNKDTLSQKTYSPLRTKRDEIRLLSIDCAEEEQASISCQLETISIRNNPTYIALSYCWGDSAVTEPIQVKGQNLDVTANLAIALRKLRAQYPLQKFWIDAICIDQSSIRERNEQVLRMGDIYSKAVSVIAWLGGEEGATSSARGMELLSNLSQVTDVEDESQLAAFPRIREVWSWESLLGILQRSYWFRIWILQEIVLGKSVTFLCGDQSISELDLNKAIVTGLSLRDSSLVGKQRGGYVWYLIDHTPWAQCMVGMLLAQERLETNQAFALDDLLVRTFDKLATDPRDKIYGLLGLVEHDIKPDYSQSVDKLFWDVGRSLVIQKSKLNVLIYAGVGWGESTSCMPTWVPNWTMEGKQKYFEERIRSNASGNRVPAVASSSDPSILTLKGIACGIVKGSKELAKEYRFKEQCWFEYLQLWREGNNPKYGPAILPTILRTIFLDTNPIDYQRIEKQQDSFYPLLDLFLHTEPPPFPDPTKIYRDYDNHIPAWKSWLNNQGEEVPDMKKRMAETIFGDLEMDRLEQFNEEEERHSFSSHHGLVYNAARMASYDLQFFWTENGFCGLGPPRVEKEDVLCIFFGCPLPVLLRKVEHRFVFVGPCYVPGIMDGEAIEALKGGEVKEECFNIV